MKAGIETKASILQVLMLEDRQEIRGIYSMVYNIVTLLSTASFAITAFLLGRGKIILEMPLVCLVTDGLIVLMLWVLFLRLKKDLYSCRQCLVARQKLIMNLGKANDPEDLDPFSGADKETPDIKDLELKYLPAMATAAIFIKALVIWKLFF
jgi:hypothetical protein